MQEKEEVNHNEFLDKLPNHIRLKIEVQKNGCWYWIGEIQSGYGIANFEGKRRSAHRVTRYLIRGDIPVAATSNTLLDHGYHCGIRCCVHPYHTAPGTSKDNIKTSKSPTHIAHVNKVCMRGHDLSIEDNVFTTSSGGRSCRKCRTIRDRNNYEKNKEEIRKQNEDNREAKRAYNREYNRKNKERVREYDKIKNSKSKIAAQVLEGKLTHEEAKAQLAKLLGVECS